MKNTMFGIFIGIAGLAVANAMGTPIVTALELFHIAAIWGILWLGVVGLEALYNYIMEGVV